MNHQHTPALSEQERLAERMINEQLRPRGIARHNVLEAMRTVPRHLFVSHEYSSRAYADEALPSLEGQTISQPYIVALMTQELAIAPGMRVLELGTGTGYQTAILSHLVGLTGEVCTIENVPALAVAARHRLEAMGFTNIRYFVGDGSLGWPAFPGEDVTFDRILVTAASPAAPPPLLAQLRNGGLLLIPLGDADKQVLTRIDRTGERFEQTALLDCRFVPLLGQHAWDLDEYRRRRADA